MSADSVTTIAATVSAAATVITALIAVLALQSTARDSRDRTRPLLVAELRRSTLGSQTQDLVIKNYGASVARDVTLIFDPPLTETDDISKNVHWICERFRRPVSVWAPGTMMSNVYKHPEENPGRRTVLISYRGPGRERYADKFDIDPAVMDLESFSNPSERPGTELERMVIALHAIARATDRQR